MFANKSDSVIVTKQEVEHILHLEKPQDSDHKLKLLKRL